MKKAAAKADVSGGLAYRTKESLGDDSVDRAWDQLELWSEKYLPSALQSLNGPAA